LSANRSLQERSGDSSKCDEVVFRFHIRSRWAKDNERIGRLTAAVTPENKTRVAAAVFVNRRVTVSELEYDLDLSHGTIVRLFRS